MKKPIIKIKDSFVRRKCCYNVCPLHYETPILCNFAENIKGLCMGIILRGNSVTLELKNKPRGIITKMPLIL